MNKPNVFPSSNKMNESMKEANEMGLKIAKQAEEEMGIEPTKKSKGEIEAQKQMEENTMKLLEAQLKKRDELRAKQKEQESSAFIETETSSITYPEQQNKPFKKVELPDEDKYAILSTPQEDVPYDLLKLPSEGLLYKNCKSSLKVAYLNAMDENIITNPNLLKSGKFLEVLINRKLMDTNLRYKDLHVGDRNAIMIWLRSTGFGPMYKIKLSDPKNNYSEFETEIDLSKLPIKYLPTKPDEDGFFDFKVPTSGKIVKFKLLTMRDIDDIEEYVEKQIKEVGVEFVNASTYSLMKQIMAIDGDYDKGVIKDFVEKKMRIGDVLSFRKEVNKIESGIDMNINVETPGGGSVSTFLPLNASFFWPEF